MERQNPSDTSRLLFFPHRLSDDLPQLLLFFIWFSCQVSPLLRPLQEGTIIELERNIKRRDLRRGLTRCHSLGTCLVHGRDEFKKKKMFTRYLGKLSTCFISLFDFSFQNKYDSEDRLIQVLMGSNLKASRSSFKCPCVFIADKDKAYLNTTSKDRFHRSLAAGMGHTIYNFDPSC